MIAQECRKPGCAQQTIEENIPVAIDPDIGKIIYYSKKKKKKKKREEKKENISSLV